MGEAFRLGGWGMYPTTIVGIVLVATALRYAIAPDAARSLLVRRLSFLTFLTGCLGFTVGVIKSFRAATETPASELGNVVVTGVGESLHNVALALVLLAITGIAMAIGTARRGASATDELVAP
jgi:hypothetical protein